MDNYSLLLAVGCIVLLSAGVELTGCANANSQRTSGTAQGAVDLLLSGQKVTEQYSTNISKCRYDATAHTLTFSGKQMAAFFRDQNALRISAPGVPLRITAFRNGQTLDFDSPSCQNQTSNGSVNLDCKQNGNHLTATIHYTQCGPQ